MSKVNVYSLNGEVLRTEALPEVFSTAFRPDIIHRAVVAEESNKRQPYGPSRAPVSGTRCPPGARAAVWPAFRGWPREPRVPSPPTTLVDAGHTRPGREGWTMKVNQKEKTLAKLSALAATADEEKVRARGHRFNEGLTLPVVVEDRLEDVKSTSEVLDTLKSIGVSDDVMRAKDGIRIRAGRGKMRGRPYRMPRSLLIVVSAHDAAVVKGARNLPGVEVAFAEMLNPGHLAPGGMPGRLTVFTESALRR